MTKLHFYPELSTYGAFEVMVLSISETATDGNNELPRNPRQFNYSWNYLRIPRLITGVVTISRALRKQRRAQRMSSSFLSRPQFWSGGGSAASAVLCKGGGGIDVTSKEKKGGPKDLAGLLSRIGLLCQSALFIEDPSNSSGNHLLIAFSIHSEAPGEKVVLPFIG